MAVVVLVLVGGCTAPQPTTPGPEQPEIVSQLFDTAWDDRTLFYRGLISSEQAAVDQLSGATVYHIDLHISDDCLLVQGHQEVQYTNRENEPLHEICFRLFPNITGGVSTVSAVTVDGQDVFPVYEFEKSALFVPLPVSLQPGETVIVQMDFTVGVTQEMGGNYGLFGYFDNVLCLDEAYPVIPVYDDETWNVEIPPTRGDVTYFDASFYLVRVTAPAALKVAASGIEIGRIDEGDSQILAFAAGPSRDFYLAASENFIVVTTSVGETTINSYAFPDRKERAEMALHVAENALRSYNARFGVYPYTEFDIVSTTMRAKGMEYPGIVAISQVLYDPEAVVSGLPSSVMLESVLAHEVAHQWFYNVVGNDQIDEPWLDEALAQYLTGLYYVDVHGEDTAQQYRSSWDDLWSQVDKEATPIGLSCNDYTNRNYAPIVYGRGPLFLMALADEMGQEIFDMFLRDYYESCKWEVGTTDAFRQRAEYYCQCDLTGFFAEWVYE
jgi:hypothetical protein